jgi:hypothetical protein
MKITDFGRSLAQDARAAVDSFDLLFARAAQEAVRRLLVVLA